MHHHYKERGFWHGKERLGKFVAFAAVTGAVAVMLPAFLRAQYKTYHRELEKDFEIRGWRRGQNRRGRDRSHH